MAVNSSNSSPGSFLGCLEPYRSSTSWESYRERLDFFFEANNITNDSTKRAIFLTMVGDTTYEVIRSLVTPSAPKDLTLAEILEKLGGHYNPIPNEIVQRYNFHKRIQRKDESIADFVASLRKLSQHCNFAELDKMLRDQIVCGVQDEALQKRLFSEPHLTLNRAFELATAAEAANKNVQDVRPTISNEILAVRNKASGAKEQADKMKPCFRCTGKHTPVNCKFKEAECDFCKKTGHIAKACFKKKRVEKQKQCNIVEEDLEDETYNLHVIDSKCSSTQRITAKVELNDTPITMEVDSGAAFTLISEQSWQVIKKAGNKLRPSSVNLISYCKKVVDVLGEAKVKVLHKNRIAHLPLLIVGGNGGSLIGRNWFHKLGIQVTGVHRITTKGVINAEKDFPEVFSDELGIYKGPEIAIQLKPNARPKFLKARRVPFAIKSVVEEAIEQLVQQGVYQPVQHSEWATPVVSVRKDDGSIRLCGDYRSTANPAIETDTYPLPTIQEILAATSGGKIFSKLDLKQGYQQLKVNDESAKILTVNTHRGLFKVCRLAFGVKAAAGVFQRTMEDVIRGLDGVIAFQDDICISGSNNEEHLHRLYRCPKTYRQYFKDEF